MTPKVASSFFLSSVLLLISGVAGQPWIQSVCIESVKDFELVLEPGEIRNVTCKIEIVQSNGNPLIEFYRSNYRRVMTRMDSSIELDYDCEENSTITTCYRVAEIHSSLADQNIQCAFYVNEKWFYSETFTVIVEEEETTEASSATVSTPLPTESKTNSSSDCSCPTPKMPLCDGSTSGSLNGSAAQFVALLLVINFMIFHLI